MFLGMAIGLLAISAGSAFCGNGPQQKWLPYYQRWIFRHAVSVSPSSVRDTFGFLFCQRPWDLKKRHGRAHGGRQKKRSWCVHENKVYWATAVWCEVYPTCVSKLCELICPALQIFTLALPTPPQSAAFYPCPSQPRPAANKVRSGALCIPDFILLCVFSPSNR